ncbi:hypothetical protein PINS_up011764 [Pythium insidiosum]|nr:hypothetical protein PINS_up011764 [Pythium insidiosum]
MVNAFDPSKPCSFPTDRWYLQRAGAKSAFPANHVPCLDAASGRMNETCVSACTCRSARREKAPSGGGAMLDYVECLRVNASFSCKGAGMVECLSETVRLAGGTFVFVSVRTR